uniref:Retrotransposon gag domain-containing protein n=1 Tax=Tanacetum cinerariifolium TaxID=118510 RepID=A0A699GLJ1_TANCI|nr:hypothetical protein [Tanacetum cinerariifolium]
MDDEPMWAVDCGVPPTLGFAITIPETANEFAIKDTKNEAVRLMMFSLSLTEEAKTWLNKLSERTIETWDELRTAFISRFFPPALFDRLLGEIRAFSQHENEYLTDAWLRIKEMLRNCHGHNLSKGNIIKIFYHGLSEITQKVLKAAAGGIFLYKIPNQAYQLLEDKVILKLDLAKNKKTKSSLKKTVAFADKDKKDNKVPLILGRPFLHTPDAVIRVKQKQLNLGVGTERMIFNIDYAMKHSYSNDDTCFSIDIIDEILGEYFNALLDEGRKILHSIEGTLIEEEIFAEFDEFMAMTANENFESESDTEEPPFEKITINTGYKIKTSLKEPPTDLKLKPFPDDLEYVFVEEPSFIPVIISSKLSTQNKSKLVSVLKKHKEALSWKTTDIPRICPSFCKHKIQLFDDKKPVVSPIHCVPKKEVLQLSPTKMMNPFQQEPLRVGEYASIIEKCHFMVKEGILLGHKVFGAGLEVDKAKINVISKLPPPTDIKGVRSFLAHAGFYRRSIKDFSKIARPLTKLLEKDISFGFDDECQKAFELLKEKLTCAPVIISPNWNLPFELLCDAKFDIEIKDRKGTENAAANHLSRIENDESSDDSEVDDNFPRETLMEINIGNKPWFIDFANYLVADIISKGMTYQQNNKFFSDLKH